MSVSEPYRDERQATRRNRPDWLVTLKRGGSVQVLRFADEASAWEFYNEQDESEDEPLSPPTRGIGSHA